MKHHYPDLPNSRDKLFSLAYLLRQVAELEAIHADWIKKVVLKKRNNPLINVMIGLDYALGYEIKNSTVPRVIEQGLLLCAFPGTTALRGAP